MVIEKGVVKATIGNGSVQVGSGKISTDVNRDISKMNTITKDEVKESIDVDVSIQTRYLTDTVDAIADDIDALVNLPGNAVQAMENTGKAAINLGDAVVSNVTGHGKDGILEDYQ